MEAETRTIDVKDLDSKARKEYSSLFRIIIQSYNIPEATISEDGSSITVPKDWEKRVRDQILAHLRRNVQRKA